MTREQAEEFMELIDDMCEADTNDYNRRINPKQRAIELLLDIFPEEGT